MTLEEVDIPSYRDSFNHHSDPQEFKHLVKQDLAERRDRYCPFVADGSTS